MPGCGKPVFEAVSGLRAIYTVRKTVGQVRTGPGLVSAPVFRWTLSEFTYEKPAG